MVPAPSPPRRFGPRREWKVRLDAGAGRELLARARDLLVRDPHTRSAEEPAYAVESLYFDSADLACYRAVRGELPKFRLRRYEGRDATWFLEEKTRIGERVWKRRVAGPPADLVALSAPATPELAWFAERLATLRLEPRLLVRYERAAFLGAAGERFTIDERLTFAPAGGPAFGIPLTNVSPSPETCIVEFKFEGPRPSATLQELAASLRVEVGPFSKYRLGVRTLGWEPVAPS